MASLDHNQQAKDLLLSQYQNSPNMIGLLNSYLSISQDIEDVAQTLFNKFDLETATGDFLDAIGQLLEVERFPIKTADNSFFQLDVSPLDRGYRFFDGQGTPYSVITDELYRNALKSWGIAMNSVGTVNDLIKSLSYLFDLDVSLIKIKNYKRFQFDVTPLDDEYTLDWNYNKIRIDVNSIITPEQKSMYIYVTSSGSRLWAKIAGIKYELYDNLGFVI